jgi:hypothetical protein
MASRTDMTAILWQVRSFAKHGGEKDVTLAEQKGLTRGAKKYCDAMMTSTWSQVGSGITSSNPDSRIHTWKQNVSMSSSLQKQNMRAIGSKEK